MLNFYLFLQNLFNQRLAKADRQSGASAVEYGLLIGLIAVAIIAVLVVLGPQLAGLFQSVGEQLPADNP